MEKHMTKKEIKAMIKIAQQPFFYNRHGKHDQKLLAFHVSLLGCILKNDTPVK